MRVDLVGPERAADVLAVIHDAFGDRPPLDPPATATDETWESVRDSLAAHGGLLGEVDGEPVATLLFEPEPEQSAPRAPRLLGLRRVGTLKQGRGTGVAQALVAAAEEEAARRGFAGVRLMARAELPATVRFWNRLGYAEAGREGPRLYLRKMLPLRLDLPTADDTRALGGRLGGVLRSGDLVILTGDLGAGKTTLTQGLADALGVAGHVTSPTFVISRVHRATAEGPDLVHVDAYRLGSGAELDDLDLDTDTDRAVTVVEWGEGLAEVLADDRLEVALARDEDDVRHAVVTPVGPRWFDTDLRALEA
ncbi:tRNA (adenosine(37)-N6)-threonylcarbamoyltransferase complex ATPase subunit type 1 TsaE [Nocardioides mangrovicus]|uniref:tRNA threonylcarbamoyladenosine biosynthesis protein TsaE n=1 Tax=Nocardioides mangrovicus TaxID=2478913 RepID=A0A3L8P651_9ACTN|nr:tRNA (adenosine(37)-N6)-threonylcarbamoyltransferase complex ATPase subunit type 1 TsaE [Nocardioides mangrovicus]RLV50691.1 tRNA (adenosine(37)-N6)-threonylcarbamoyltransferase complex ATPase subunit type 1 TsaE [Nocardioides mangrovicus]